jgi:hypothetical protein
MENTELYRIYATSSYTFEELDKNGITKYELTAGRYYSVPYDIGFTMLQMGKAVVPTPMQTMRNEFIDPRTFTTYGELKNATITVQPIEGGVSA